MSLATITELDQLPKCAGGRFDQAPCRMRPTRLVVGYHFDLMPNEIGWAAACPMHVEEITTALGAFGAGSVEFSVATVRTLMESLDEMYGRENVMQFARFAESA